MAERTAASKKNTRSGRPKGSKREDTLARILPVARKLFAEKGFAQTTFKDIGKAVGITHAALYAYFPSKSALYIATLEDTQAQLLPYYLEAIASSGNLRERLTGILMASAKAHDRDSTITGFLAAVPIEMRRHEELYQLLSSQNNEVMNALEGIFHEARENGEIAGNTSPENLAAALFGGGVGVALFQYGMQAPNLTEAMEVFVAMIEARLFN